jgi:hypothetical protein
MQLRKMSEAKLTQNLETHGLKMNYLIMIMVARKVVIVAIAERKLQRKNFEAVWDCWHVKMVVGC